MLRKIIVGAIAFGAVGLSAATAEAAVVKNIIYGTQPTRPIFGETIEDQGYDYSFGFDDSSNGKGFNTSYSTNANNSFISSLTNPTTQDFNSFASGTVKSLPLNFGDAGTGNFVGKGDLSRSIPDYPQTSSQLLHIGNRTDGLNIPGSTFNEFDFSKPVGAIGFSFYTNGQDAMSPTNLELTKTDGTTKLISLPGVFFSNAGQKKIYFDVTAQDLSEQFSKIRFIGESSRVQDFALENITAAGFDQIKKPTPVPEPTTILGSSLAIAFGVVLRRKFKK